ncbi:NirD/YgiW/YdeI family stress tolerance protein [Shewanella sp. Isolate11]|uniref:YgiW/YdeI family stress tolerance OB fold protein n=1 Tax=Shewanella sp. Isolate11 TaxID=2908530 RepID=UPI001EFD0B03|nr:NirD/YgiW/YdeI family stress tolerance protein [Shewanella sp. Isolate11]
MYKLSGMVILLCLMAFPALAGYKGPSAEVIAKSAIEALKAKDDTRLELTGYIVKSLGDEKYLFRDGTGEATVEIDDSLWRGIEVSDTTKVALLGEVDDDWFGNEIEIEQINLIAE